MNTQLVKGLGGSGLAMPVEVVQFCWKYNAERLKNLPEVAGCEVHWFFVPFILFIRFIEYMSRWTTDELHPMFTCTGSIFLYALQTRLLRNEVFPRLVFRSSCAWMKTSLTWLTTQTTSSTFISRYCSYILPVLQSANIYLQFVFMFACDWPL